MEYSVLVVLESFEIPVEDLRFCQEVPGSDIGSRRFLLLMACVSESPWNVLPQGRWAALSDVHETNTLLCTSRSFEEVLVGTLYRGMRSLSSK
eukprot:scaffold301_cov243-Pinguiococcus_pyrenoidosus.AAC.130